MQGGGGGLRSAIFRNCPQFHYFCNFPQFSAIYRNFRNFSDLSILRATVLICWFQCASYSCCSCCPGYRNFPQFSAIFRNFPVIPQWDLTPPDRNPPPARLMSPQNPNRCIRMHTPTGVTPQTR